MEFYRNVVLGLPVRQQKDSTESILGVGSGFLALDQSGKSNIDHFCIGVKDFKLGKAAFRLKRLGFQPEVLRNTELSIRDPDGIRVQLSSPDYRGQMA